MIAMNIEETAKILQSPASAKPRLVPREPAIFAVLIGHPNELKAIEINSSGLLFVGKRCGDPTFI